MRNEKGLTLVELLAVIVILAIIAIIAVVSISQVMKNARADTHLANARNVLEVGKMAYAVGDEPTQEYEGAKKYTLQDLSDMGYLADTIQSPTIFSWSKITYDTEYSMVIVDERESPVKFKVNLSIGEKNYIFKESVEEQDIKRENLTDLIQGKSPSNEENP